ncbi:S8 family serine peptidase [Labilibacter marinus]|uniref:S8 family serine peptidase n=1 Tax=Labilibacter marinus TaxID=1477105 RepID=UPI0009F9DA24|nr:S8 family serine peptidase [Labilibacter marinus]
MNKKNRHIYFFITLLIMVTNVVMGQGVVSQEDCEKGRIRIKLKREQLVNVNSQLKSATSVSDGSNLGIQSIDNISQDVGIIRIKRVFPFSLKNEAKHREYDLHLWMELEFDEAINPLDIVKQYDGLQELELVKPIYKKVRIDSDKEAVPYKVKVLNTGATKVVSSSASTITSSNYEPFFDDPLLNMQWHYQSDGSLMEDGYDIDLFEAWKQTTGSSDVIVSIVDQGVDVYHEDLQDNIWRNEAEINGEEGVDDDMNGYIDDFHGFNFRMEGAIVPGDHGTHVAGTVGAVSNNGIGVSGVAGGDGSGNGVKMISCQVFDHRARGGTNFAQAIVYGADNGAVISQNSWGYDGVGYYEPEVYDAIKYFIAEAGQYEGSPMKGGIVVFAAGNEGVELDRYPAAFDETIAVTALGPNGMPAGYTNYGDWSSIAGPGGYQPDFGEEGGILSTLANDKYGYMDGTSMACPHVSGVAALVIAKFGGDDFSAEDLKRFILNSTQRFTFQHNNKYGSGALNAANALADDNRIPPEAISDLNASEIFHDEIRLEWTVPVDEDNGEPRYYYLCIAGENITEQNFDNQALYLLQNELRAGETYNIKISGFRKLTDYWFALKSADQFDNFSDISNVLKVTTSNLPHFMESTRLVSVDVDVTQSSTVKVPIGLSNIGDGIIYYNSTIRNEKFYWEPEEEDVNQEIAASIQEKKEEAEANPALYETNQAIFKEIPSLKSTAATTSDLSHWKNDNTEWIAGLSYQNANPPATLLGSGNSNVGVVAATRFDIPYDYSLNVTHLEVALLPEVNDKPIIIELRKGSKWVQECETVYMQEYYPDTTNVLQYYRIPLYRPQLFEDNEIFWVILHFPKEMSYPLVLQNGELEYGYCVVSKDNEVSYRTLSTFFSTPKLPMLSVLSSGDDGSYVFLDPTSGEIPSGQSVNADVLVDATNLTNGKHLASLGILTNDIHKPVVNIEVKVNVSGQVPEIDTNKSYPYKAYFNESNTLLLDIQNKGLADLEVFDVISTTPGISKAFNDTVVFTPNMKGEVPFSYVPELTGFIETQVTLRTNIGDVNLACEFSIVDAPVLEMNANNVVDIVYGEKNAFNLQLSNKGVSTQLEYDLSHYNTLNTSKGLFPYKLAYEILSSKEIDGPIEGAWDDITAYGKAYNQEEVKATGFELGMNFPFFSETLNKAYISTRGELFFYYDGLFYDDVDAEYYGYAKGVLVPVRIQGYYLSVAQVYVYSFGDRSVFTVRADIKKPGNPPNQSEGSLEYQIVLSRDGSIEFRYNKVSDLQEDWDYRVGIQGLIGDDLLIYKDYEEIDKNLYDGKVLSFQPLTDVSMVVSATPTKGLINAGGQTPVQIELDPASMGLTEGVYKNNVVVKTNTLNKEELFPLTINVTGTPKLIVNDTISFDTIKLGRNVEGFIVAENVGSSNVTVDAISFDNPNFVFSGSLPLVIKAKSKQPLKVVYTPIDASEEESLAHISFSDGTTKSIVLNGKCIEDVTYDITVAENIIVDINAGESLRLPITLTNHDKGELLEYTFKGNWLSYVEAEELDRAIGNNSHDSYYGYWWRISDSDKPYFKWEDISDDAEVLSIEQDEQKQIELPFQFPFFGEYYNTIWVSKNGYVTVIEPESDHWSFEFAKEDGLSGMIAPFWSPILPPEDGKGVMLKMDESRLVLQWDNFTPEEGGLGILTFQLEIMADGTIHFHYNNIDPFSGGLQYGLESPDEEETVENEKTWILTWSKLSNKSSISFIPPLKDSIVSGGQKELDLVLSAERIYKSGVYRDTVELLTNSQSQALYQVPIQLNVTGKPILDVVTPLDWDETVYKSNLLLNRKIKLVNKGFDVLHLNKVEYQQLDDLVLYETNGEKIIKSNAGELFKDIVIEPWEAYELIIEIPVKEQQNVAGSINWLGNFESQQTSVSTSIVDSPIFSWDATDQSYSLNNTEVAEYSFTVKNKGETKLKYNFAPAVAPSGGESEFPVIIEEEGNFTLNYPITVDSLFLDKKENADGVLIPWIEGNNKGFSNRFTAPQGGFFLTHVKAYTCLLNVDEIVKVEIWMGGDLPQDGEKLYEELYVVDKVVDEKWVFFSLSQPITIPEGEQFFVTIYQNKSTKYMGFENVTDENLKSNCFSGNHVGEEEYYWWPHYEDLIWKIRPLTAAGEDSWIELDKYSGELQANESVEVSATIYPLAAGKGAHVGKIISLSNDVNNSSSEFNIALTINGAPEFKFYPNIYKDTIRVRETEELLLNYLYEDPEGESISFTLDSSNQGPQLKYEVTGNTTAQVKIKTDYNDEGTYTYPVMLTDASGSISSDTIVIQVEDKNRAPVLNEEFAVITLNLADPRALTIDPTDVFSDPDGDALQFLAGNYTPEIVDMSLGSKYINLNPLTAGTGFLAFAADDGKEDGFVVYGVYVQVIDDPDAVNASLDGNQKPSDNILGDDQYLMVYPNPVSNGECNVIYKVDEDANVLIEVYSATGYKVEMIQYNNITKGEYSNQLNVERYTQGIYLCRLLVNGVLIETKKLNVR